MFLGELSVRGYNPPTAGNDVTARKQELYTEFMMQNDDDRIDGLREKCRGRQLSLRVAFYLNKDVLNPTEHEKDLDNLLKVSLDVIKGKEDNEEASQLGLVGDDVNIFKISCHKEIVDHVAKAGIDLKISEFGARSRWADSAPAKSSGNTQRP